MTIRRALGYAAALPVSAAAAAILPLVVATGGRVRARDGVIEAEGGVLGPLLARGNPWFPIAAITLGHVVLAVDARALESTRAHERIHVRQYERFGFLFPVAVPRVEPARDAPRRTRLSGQRVREGGVRTVGRCGGGVKQTPRPRGCRRRASRRDRGVCANGRVARPRGVERSAGAEGKWTPAQIVQHLILGYEAGLRELDGGVGLTVVVPWWKRIALRWTILPRILAGRFPAGARGAEGGPPDDGFPSPRKRGVGAPARLRGALRGRDLRTGPGAPRAPDPPVLRQAQGPADPPVPRRPRPAPSPAAARASVGAEAACDIVRASRKGDTHP